MDRTDRFWVLMATLLVALGTFARAQHVGADILNTNSLPAFLQQAKFTSSDGTRLSFLGASVAVSGNTVVIGIADTSTPGAVYVFQKPASGWTSMTQTAKLTASDGAPNDYLGYSVAIDGDTIVAGAPNSNQYRGAAYVFTKFAGGWSDMTETAKLVAPGLNTTAGSSVAISGNTVAVGSPDVGSSAEAGAVYIFERPAGGWRNVGPTAKLTASDGYSYGAFGSSVAISGNTVVAGEPNGPGKAYVFVEPPTGWTNMTQTAWLLVSGGVAGFSVATNGNTVVTGYPYATIGSNYAQGAAYVFVKPGGGWTDMTPTATLTASDGEADSWLGYSVAINGKQIALGSPFTGIGSNSAQGAAYTFIEPATGWKTTSHFNAKVVASDGAESDELGWSVSYTGSTLVVGAPGATSQRGAGYLFVP